MSTQTAAALIPEGQAAGNPAGRVRSNEGLNPAILGGILKLTKTKELFVHFEIGFKKTTPRVSVRAAEVPATQGEMAAPQAVHAVAAASPRQAPTLLDSTTSGNPGSSTTGSSLYVQLKGGVSVTPPDGYPPPL